MRIFLTETTIMDKTLETDLRALITLYNKNAVEDYYRKFLLIIDIYDDGKNPETIRQAIESHTKRIIFDTKFLLGIIISECQIIIKFGGLTWMHDKSEDYTSLSNFLLISKENMDSLLKYYK